MQGRDRSRLWISSQDGKIGFTSVVWLVASYSLTLDQGLLGTELPQAPSPPPPPIVKDQPRNRAFYVVVDGEGKLTFPPRDEFSLPYPWLFPQDVGYPEFLNIRPYMSQSNGEPVMYGLYAVLVHSGYSCHAGHYYCYVKVSAPVCRCVRTTWRCLLVQFQMWPPWKVTLSVVVFRACCCCRE